METKKEGKVTEMQRVSTNTHPLKKKKRKTAAEQIEKKKQEGRKPLPENLEQTSCDTRRRTPTGKGCKKKELEYRGDGGR